MFIGKKGTNEDKTEKTELNSSYVLFYIGKYANRTVHLLLTVLHFLNYLERIMLASLALLIFKRCYWEYCKPKMFRFLPHWLVRGGHKGRPMCIGSPSTEKLNSKTIENMWFKPLLSSSK